MLPYIQQQYGNPSSLHTIGTDQLEPLSEALDHIYNIIHADDQDDIIFTSGWSESNNHVLQTIVLDALARWEKPHLIISNVEHHCIENTARFLQDMGAELSYITVDTNGQIDPKKLTSLIQGNTILISIILANNETGIITDIAQLVAAKNSINPEILFHTDAVQAIGKIPVNVQTLGVDYMSISAHKFHGPKGVGALYMKHGKTLRPFIFGWGQMGGLRGGTENVIGIIGMGQAAKNTEELIHIEQTQVKKLRDTLEKGLIERIPKITIAGKASNRTPNTLFIAFEGIEGEALLWDLNQAGIAASTGSACASVDLEASHILIAMGFAADLAHTGVRLSLSKYNTEEEINTVIETLPKIVERLRSISNEWGK